MLQDGFHGILISDVYDWEEILRPVAEPHLPLSNNAAEQALRHWVIARLISHGPPPKRGLAPSHSWPASSKPAAVVEPPRGATSAPSLPPRARAAAPSAPSHPDSSIGVNDYKDTAGLNASQIAQKLTINEADTFTIIRFPTPQAGLASPINRLDPGFVGGGRTAGGAREFVIPNGPIPAGAKIGVVEP